MATEWVKTSHKRPVPWAKQWLMTRLNILLHSSCSTIEFYSSCPCYANQIVAINRSQLVWPQTSDVVWVRANVFGISKRWIPLNYQIISTEFPRKPILPRMVEYEFTSEGNVKETQRFTVLYHTVLFYLMYSTCLPGSKCESKRKNQTQMWERQIKASSITFI